MARWLGIDFSGDHRMWRPGRAKSNVWIAELSDDGGDPVVTGVSRVQELEGRNDPFDRLCRLLGLGDYEVAGIDAPFSVPWHRVPNGDHEVLLQQAKGWDAEGRAFPRGTTLVKQLAPEAAPLGVKEYRETESGWGVNVRSTVWAGARGGAPMTAACLALLGAAHRPIWPWPSATGTGLLAEAFPAAQLRAWDLPYQRYNETDAIDSRRSILVGLANRCHWSPTIGALMLGSADALDAVVCCLGAWAVSTGAVSRQPKSVALVEGWIAVHS